MGGVLGEGRELGEGVERPQTGKPYFTRIVV